MSGKNFDTVIIGSGLGGLICGAILSKNGFRVCVLEKQHKIGGNLQTFNRKGVKFNSAMHYVGAMDKGQILHKVFSYLDILDSTGLEKLDETKYETVYLGDKVYSHANGIEGHRERLLSYFPLEKEAIDSYLEQILKVWNSTNVLNLQDFRNLMEADTQYTQVNAFETIKKLTNNEDLRMLWGVTSALHAGLPESSPLLTHAIIYYHYIQSAYKFSKGSDLLANSLEKVIIDHDGEVLRNKEVLRFLYKEKNASAVQCSDGSVIEAKSFISNIHPAQLVKLVEPGRFRKAYVSRVEELKNTVGSFCVYIKLKSKQIKNINSNVFISTTRDVWNAGNYQAGHWPEMCIMYTTPDPLDTKFAESMTISSFMKFEEVKQWEETRVEQRGEAYKSFKKEKAEALMDLVATKFHDLPEAVEAYYTASPLTFRDYTGTTEGSMYGILKDCNNPRRSYISPNTKIPNLFQTGQNSGVGLHGALGVTVSALFTCANFIDTNNLLEEIRNE